MCKHYTVRRIGAYILPGDDVWLRSSLQRYYHILDDLVVMVPLDGLGWTGRRLAVDACLAIVDELDTRGIARRIEGRWQDENVPLRAELEQRQAGLAASSGVDWVLQIDNDEVLPDPEQLLRAMDVAERRHVEAVEWPMRVLYREVGRGKRLAVCGADGEPRFDYPGAVAVRPTVRLVDCRRSEGPYLRVVVRGDVVSLQVARPPEPAEQRLEMIGIDDAIVHNSWARSASEVWRKTRAGGHTNGLRGARYFLGTWLPAPFTWRLIKDFHPFAHGLWPALRPYDLPVGLLADQDRHSVRRTASRSRVRNAGRSTAS